MLERLWSKIEIRGPDECWPWLGWKHRSGYPGFDRPKGYAHRLIVGAQPGEIVRHSCDNPGCCNPRHLKRGTQAENLREMVERGRSNRGERHWNVKLTADQVSAIRADPRSSRLVALDYPVSEGAVRKIRRSERWS